MLDKNDEAIIFSAALKAGAILVVAGSVFYNILVTLIPFP